MYTKVSAHVEFNGTVSTYTVYKASNHRTPDSLVFVGVQWEVKACLAIPVLTVLCTNTEVKSKAHCTFYEHLGVKYVM